MTRSGRQVKLVVPDGRATWSQDGACGRRTCVHPTGTRPARPPQQVLTRLTIGNCDIN